MDAEKTDNGPIRFFAIGYGTVEGYWETFVLATSPEEALNRYVQWGRKMNADRGYCKEKVNVLEADLNDHGILESTIMIWPDKEVEC